ncbi:hypothetical protein P9112_008634 [Eukaryota sp. TZLM1-RC]
MISEIHSTEASTNTLSLPIQETSESFPLQQPYRRESSMLHDATSPPHASLSPSAMLQTPHCSFSDLSDANYGVKSISSNSGHSLLLTYSGEVYSWGFNDSGQVLYDGPRSIKSPIKLPLTNIISVSTGHYHSLSLSSEGKLYGWGCNDDNQIDISSISSLPVTHIDIPYNIKEVCGGEDASFALTQEGQVVKWGVGLSFELIEDLSDIDHVYAYGDSFVAIDGNGDFFCKIGNHFIIKIPVTQSITPKLPLKGSISLIVDSVQTFLPHEDIDFDEIFSLFVIDIDGNFWIVGNNEVTKNPDLSNIFSISIFDGFCSAINTNRKVLVWSALNRISDVYANTLEPRCIEAFTNIEGISVGNNYVFAYNKNTVWAWGRNDRGQLGTGDLIDRPQPVKVFGSEILGSLHYPKQPLDRMFSGLAKLIYFEYLQYLKNLFGNHPYTKARFLTKCSISKKVAKFTKTVIDGFKFLKDPQDLESNDNICDLKLRLSTDFQGPKVINTRIKKLDVYFDEVDYDPQLLSFFPNVEVLKLHSVFSSGRQISLNLTHLSNLNCLEIDGNFDIEQLPTSLVKLVLNNYNFRVTDLSYLTSLKEFLVVYFSQKISTCMLTGQIPLPQSIVKLEVWLDEPVNIEVQLPNLKELVIHYDVPSNITEQNFPSLKFIQLIKPYENILSHSPLFPTKLSNQGLIKFVKLIKNEYLVELSCFPWWIQYRAQRFLIDIFSDHVDEKVVDS